MKLEEALTQSGNDPISKLPNFRAIIAYVNGNFSKAGLPSITETTSSDKLLEAIYSLQDATLQTLILERPIKEIKGNDPFKNTLVWAGGLLTIIIVGTILMDFFGGSGSIAPETMELFKLLGSGILELVKMYFASQSV